MKISLNERKILIIDDEEDILKLLSMVLKKEGFENIYVAEDAKSGFSLFQEINPDIILLDIMLPDQEGYEVCKKIRETSNVPILFMSAKTEEIDEEKIEVKKNGKLIEFKPKEYKMFLYMVKHPNQILSKEKLCDKIWGGRLYRF